MNKAMSGVVLRRSGDKSVTAAVERLVKHPVVGKHVKKRTKIMCHDEANECIAGDRVTIEPCRKLSKRKSFRIVEIVKPNPIIGKGRRVALREEAHPNPAFRGAASRVAQAAAADAANVAEAAETVDDDGLRSIEHMETLTNEHNNSYPPTRGGAQ